MTFLAAAWVRKPKCEFRPATKCSRASSCRTVGSSLATMSLQRRSMLRMESTILPRVSFAM